MFASRSGRSKGSEIAVARELCAVNGFEQIKNSVRVGARLRRTIVESGPQGKHIRRYYFARLHPNPQKNGVFFVGAVAGKSNIAQSPGNHSVTPSLKRTKGVRTMGRNYFGARRIAISTARRSSGRGK